MAIRLTESRLRQIIREEASKFTRRPSRRLYEMSMEPAVAPEQNMKPGPVGVVSIYAGPDGAELELGELDDGSDEAFKLRDDFEDDVDTDSPGGYGMALKRIIPRLKRLGVTQVQLTVGDEMETVPVDASGPALTRLVRKAMRAMRYDY